MPFDFFPFFEVQPRPLSRKANNTKQINKPEQHSLGHAKEDET